MSTKSFNIIVSGGGMVGMAVANALAQSDFEVAVIESREPQSFDVSQDYDLRVSAVTLETVDFLKNIDVWDSVIETRTCHLKAMRVWEESGFGDVTFDAKTIGEDNIGYIVENRILQLALWEKAKSDANIKIFCPETHKNIHVDNDQVEVTLSNDEKIYSKLLVGADGARSSIREQFSFGVKSKQYDQSCLVANASVVNNSQNITWQRFTPSGPQAYLPLDDNTGSIVWYDSAEAIQSYVDLSNEDLSKKIMREFPREIGKVIIKDKASFPIFKQHVEKYVLDNVTLVGDSAHVINPLAGQGVNLGFQDAECLSRILKAARDRTENWASSRSMIKYERERYFHNSAMMNLMNVFYYGFSNDNHSLKLARNLALSFGNFQPLNKMIGKLGAGKLKSKLFAE